MKIKNFNVKDVDLVDGKLQLTLDLILVGKTETEEYVIEAVLMLPFKALKLVLDFLKDKL